jgi:6-phosphogluconolactonase (cycloisomerase 2 family)
MGFSHDGRFLFSLNNGNGTVSVFEVKSNGSLEAMGGLSGLPVTSAGLGSW